MVFGILVSYVLRVFFSQLPPKGESSVRERCVVFFDHFYSFRVDCEAFTMQLPFEPFLGRGRCVLREREVRAPGDLRISA